MEERVNLLSILPQLISCLQQFGIWTRPKFCLLGKGLTPLNNKNICRKQSVIENLKIVLERIENI